MNKIVIIGRLCADPELKQTQNGTSLVEVSVAVDRRTNGEKATDFFPVQFWNKTAEFVAQYFHKGKLIAIDGRMQNERWTDKDGNNRERWRLVANSAEFCGGKDEAQEEQAPENYEGLPF